jgi:TrmH family RNA methyltransferase
VEGDKITAEIIQLRPASIEQLYMTENWHKKPGVSFRQISASKIFVLTPAEMKKISSFKSPPEVIAVVQIPYYQLDFDELSGSLSLVLDKVQDPGNLGNIIRIADWFGIHNVICSSDSADCFNPKVLQATMGSIMRIKIHYTDLEVFLQKFSQVPEFGIYGTFLNASDIYTSSLLPSGLIVMGNESRGIRKELFPYIRERISVPAFPNNEKNIDSLNVAAAAAIICSEFRRRIE